MARSSVVRGNKPTRKLQAEVGLDPAVADQNPHLRNLQETRITHEDILEGTEEEQTVADTWRRLRHEHPILNLERVPREGKVLLKAHLDDGSVVVGRGANNREATADLESRLTKEG